MLGRRTAMLVLLTVVSLLVGTAATPAFAAGTGGGEGGGGGTLTVSTTTPNPRVGDILTISPKTNVLNPLYNVQMGTGPAAVTLFAGEPPIKVPLDQVPLGVARTLTVGAQSQDNDVTATATLTITKRKIPSSVGFVSGDQSDNEWPAPIRFQVNPDAPTSVPASGTATISSSAGPTVEVEVQNNVITYPYAGPLNADLTLVGYTGDAAWAAQGGTFLGHVLRTRASTKNGIGGGGPTVAGKSFQLNLSARPVDPKTPAPAPSMPASLMATQGSTTAQVWAGRVTPTGPLVDIADFTRSRTGTWGLTLTTSTDGNYFGSTTPVTFIDIAPANGTTTTLAKGSDPAYIGGATIPVTATVKVNDGRAPDGNVQFYVDDQLVDTAPVAGGKATGKLPVAALGDHSARAVYASPTQLGSTSGNVTYQVLRAPSSVETTVAGSMPVNSEVTAQVKAPDTGIKPAGVIRLVADGHQVAEQTLDGDGAAKFDLTSVGRGLHNLRFIYGGSAAIVESETSAVVQLTEPTYGVGIALEVLGGLVVDPVDAPRLGVTMTTADGRPPLGDVDLYVDGAKLQTKEAASILSFADLPADEAKTYQVVVKSQGGGAQRPSEQRLTYTVTKAETTTKVTQPEGPISSDDDIVVKVTVKDSTTPLLQKVNVYRSGSTNPLGQVTLTEGVGGFKPPTDLAPGSYILEFEYPGDGKTRSHKDAVFVTVVKPTDTTLTIDHPSVVVGGGVIVTATATVKDRAGNLLSGDVLFAVGSGAQQKKTLVDGVATLTLPVDKVDDLQVVAKFAGSGTLATSRQTTPFSVVKAGTNISVEVPPNATVFDEVKVAVTATGTSMVPSGKVSVTGSGVTREVELDPTTGKGNLKLSGLAAGSYDLVFDYAGDGNMKASPQLAKTVAVVKATTSMSLTPAESKATVRGTQLVTLKATVLDAAQHPAAGDVVFSGVGEAKTVELSDGVAELTLPAETVDTYTVVPAFAGDEFQTSSRASATYEVVKANTTTPVDTPTKVTEGTNPKAKVSVDRVGSTMPLLAPVHVTGGGFDDDIDLLAGAGEIGLGSLIVGKHDLVFEYQGDDSTEKSSHTVSVTVVPDIVATETSLVFSRENPVAGSDPFSVTATVKAGDEVVTDGDLAFYVDDVFEGSLIVDGPVTKDLPIDVVKDHDLRVEYTSGGAAYEPSDANAGYTVVKAAAEMQVTLPDEPSAADSASVTLQATNSSLVPTGDVQVNVDGSDRTFRLKAGTVDVPLAGLEPGPYTLVFDYDGDDWFDGVEGQERTVVVVPTPTTTSIAFNRVEPIVGSESFTATATVKDDNGKPVTEGEVAFYLGDDLLETDDLSGEVEVELPTDEVGEHAVTAKFSGTGSWVASDVTDTYWVSMADSTLDVDVPDDPTTADTVTFTLGAEGTPLIPTGKVQISSGSFSETFTLVDGVVRLDLADLGVGEHELTIFYEGDGKANWFRTTVSVEVAQGDVPEETSVELELSRDETVVGSDELTVTATVKAGGEVLTEGNLEFRVDGKEWMSRPVVGPVTVALPIDEVGQREVTAKFTGGSAYVPSDKSARYEVVAADTEVLLDVPTTTVAGVAKVRVRATNSSVVPSARVHVTGEDVDTWLTLDAEGRAEWRLWGLEPRVYHLNFAYEGNGATHVSDEDATVEVIEGLTSEMTVENREKALTSDKVKINVDAQDSEVVPTGDVVVTRRNGSGFGEKVVHLKDGEGTLPLSDFALETYELRFEYLGDDNVRPTASDTWFEVVEPGSIPVGTFTELELGGTSAVVGGTPITATAKVAVDDDSALDGTLQLWVDFFPVDSRKATGEPVTFDLPANAVKNDRKVWVMFKPSDPSKQDQSSSRLLKYSVVRADTQVSVEVPGEVTAKDSVPVVVESTNSSVVPAGDVVVSGEGIEDRTVKLHGVDGDGVGELSLAGLGARSYELTFHYVGDDNTNESSTDPVTVKVVKVATSMSLTPAESSAIVGGTELVTVTARVLDAAEEPVSGDVVFAGVGTATKTVTLVDGVAEWTLPAEKVDGYTVTADFAGDEFTASAHADAAYSVVKAESLVALEVPAKVTVADVVKVAVTAKKSSLVPSGQVHVTGSGVDERFTLDDKGEGELKLTGLGLGEHVLAFEYLGDEAEQINGSSQEATFEIVETATVTSLVLSGDGEAVVGGAGSDLVTATATVTDADDAPVVDGEVVFTGVGEAKTVTLNGEGVASWTLPAEAVKSYQVTASFDGAGDLGGSSDSADYRVVRADTKVTVDVSGDLTAADSVPVVVESTNSSVVPAGDVVVSGEGIEDRTVKLHGVDGDGVGELSLAGLGARSYELTFAYEGDDHTKESSTDPVTVVVSGSGEPVVTEMSLVVAPESVVFGDAQESKVTATVLDAGGEPVEGDVVFTVGSGEPVSVGLDAGAAVLDLPTGVVGEFSVSAVFEAPGYVRSEKSGSYTVVKADTQTTVTAPVGPVGTGASVAVTVGSTNSSVLPAGAVKVTGEGVEKTVTLDEVVDGKAVGALSLAGLVPGEHELLFTYEGDDHTKGSSAESVKVIVKQTSGSGETSTGLTLTPQEAPFGGAKVLATATPSVPVGEVAAGLVAFEVGDWFKLVPVQGGVATLELDVDKLGPVEVTAYYLGTTSLNSSTSDPVSYTVVKAGTETLVAGPQGPVAAGDEVPVRVKSTNSAVVPTGRVHVTGDGVDVWVTLQGAEAEGDGHGKAVGVFEVPVLTPGSHDLRFAYEGDDHTDESSANATVIVRHIGGTSDTVTKLSLSAKTAPIRGPKVRASAAVATPSGQAAVGVVAFQIGEWFTLVPLEGGSAGVDLDTDKFGSVPVKAYYLGSGDLNASESDVVTYDVVKAATVIAVDGASGDLVPGANLPVSVTATGSPVVPTGRVTVSDGTAALPALDLVNGKATLSLAGLATGSHTLSLEYAGDGQAAVAKAQVIVSIKPLVTTTTVVLSRAKTTPKGAAVTATAQVKVANGAVPDGALRFEVDGKVLATLPAGASATSSTLPIDKVGTHRVLVTYVASPTQAASAAGAATYTVAKEPVKLAAKFKKVKRKRVMVTVTLKAASPILGKIQALATPDKKGKKVKLKLVAKGAVKKAGTTVKVVMTTKALKKGKWRLTIRYLGSTYVLPLAKTFKVRVR
jgi:hypothetical protein